MAHSRKVPSVVVPLDSGYPDPHYGGRGTSYSLPENVKEVQVVDIARQEFDLVIYQSRVQWETERFRILTPDQQRLPAIYIEHDPPLDSPAQSVHPVAGTDVLLVHVTEFNRLMWDAPGVRDMVIEHGVVVPVDVQYSGETPRGLAAVNNLATRGRRIGFDIVQRVRESAPIEVVGMGAEAAGGTGEIPPLELAAYEAHFRFFLNPMRWTSLSMAVCEAMLVGMPIIAPATNEIVTVIRPGIEGYVDTSVDRLAAHAARLIRDRDEAKALGANARETARRRFGIDRFVADWEQALALAAGTSAQMPGEQQLAGVAP